MRSIPSFARRRHQIDPDLVECRPERRGSKRQHLRDRIEGDVVLKHAEAPSFSDRPRHDQLPDGGWAVQEDQPGRLVVIVLLPLPLPQRRSQRYPSEPVRPFFSAPWPEAAETCPGYDRGPVHSLSMRDLTPVERRGQVLQTCNQAEEHDDQFAALCDQSSMRSRIRTPAARRLKDQPARRRLE